MRKRPQLAACYLSETSGPGIESSPSAVDRGGRQPRFVRVRTVNSMRPIARYAHTTEVNRFELFILVLGRSQHFALYLFCVVSGDFQFSLSIDRGRAMCS